MSKLLSISEAAKMLSVSVSTLRRWEREGRIAPAVRTQGKQRRYDPFLLEPHRKRELISSKKTVAYARVSSREQKSDLERQLKSLELFCAANGWSYELIQDIGSGINYKKKGLQSLLEALIEGSVGRLVITLFIHQLICFRWASILSRRR